jgi:2-polyprenyl-3-methyl-5-hydroxy-6-metoxy-1,4-benzoquinol methylase
MDNEIARLEQFATVYSEEISSGYEKKLHTITARYVSKMLHTPCLEMGCGNGTWTRIILEHLARLDVLDASDLLLTEIAKEHGEKVTCHRALFEEFSPQSNYSTILLAGSLHHTADPRQVLSRIRSWMSVDAELIIVVPNAESLHRRLGLCMKLIADVSDISSLGDVQGHRRVYCDKTLAEDLQASGFEIVGRHGLHLKPFSNSQMEHIADDVVEGLFRLSHELPADLSAMLFFRCKKR